MARREDGPGRQGRGGVGDSRMGGRERRRRRGVAKCINEIEIWLYLNIACYIAPSGSCVRRPFGLEAIHHAGARASQGGDAARARRPKDARRRVFRPPLRVGSAPSVAPAPEALCGSGSIDAVTMDVSDDDFWETRARKMSEAPASGVAPHTAPATFASSRRVARGRGRTGGASSRSSTPSL